jgi:tRNA-(ms[2]io[6]A)-hydroxylase
MAKSDLSKLVPLLPSPEAWVDTVLQDFETFLQDHASAEKKASGMALSMASHYPDRLDLVSAMVDLAVEELNHYREVMRILLGRKIAPRADRKDA